MFIQLRRFRVAPSLALAIVAAVLLAMMTSGTHAQTAQESPSKPASPPSGQTVRPAPEGMQKSMEAMGPMMGQMMSAMLDGMLAVLSKPETAQRTAAFTKNYYDALIAKGFSNEDALKIVMAHGIPMPGGR
jgi:hypothetical protein